MLSNGSFIYTHISEAMTSKIVLTLFVTIIYLVPYIIYHAYQFVVPGYYRFETIKLKWEAISYSVIWVLSQLVAYTIFLPNISKILISLNTSIIIQYIPKISEYIQFIIYLSLGSYFYFLVPTILFIIVLKFPIFFFKYSNHRALLFLITGSFISIITPTDYLIFFTTFLFSVASIELWTLCYCISNQWHK